MQGYRVGKPVAAAALELRELDRLLHGRVVGHAAEVEELEEAHPQRVAQRRIDRPDRARRQPR